jgi:hypothetical protein
LKNLDTGIGKDPCGQRKSNDTHDAIVRALKDRMERGEQFKEGK